MKTTLKTTLTTLALSTVIFFTGCSANTTAKDGTKSATKEKVTEISKNKDANTKTEDTSKKDTAKTESAKTETKAETKKEDTSKSSSSSTANKSDSSNTTSKSSSSSSNSNSNSSSTKPSSSNSNTSSSGTTSKPQTHTHTWQNHTAVKQVQVGIENIYHEEVKHQVWLDEGSCNVCNVCGTKMYSSDEISNHESYHDKRGEESGYHYEKIGHYEWVIDQEAYTETNPIYENQSYVDYQYCSCGARR